MTANLTFSKLSAVIYYELLILWRQRVIPVAMIALTLSLLLLDWVAKQPIPDTSTGSRSVMLQASLVYLYIVALVLLPILIADSVPRDRQYRVRELWRTLPLTDGVYLSGKVLATSIAMGVGMLIAALVGGSGYYIIAKPFYMGAYLKTIVLGVLPIAATVPALAVLFASGQPTRRRAMLMGVAISTGSLFLIGLVAPSASDLINYVNPTRPIVLLDYLYQTAALIPRDDSLGVVTDAQLMLAALIGFIELAAATMLTTAAFRWAQSR